jgi:hypothetical protein
MLSNVAQSWGWFLCSALFDNMVADKIKQMQLQCVQVYNYIWRKKETFS